MRNIQLAQILALALSANALPSGAPAQREIQTWKGRDPAKNKPHQGKREMERRKRRMAPELPEGARMLNGELQLCCRVCDKWYESPVCLSDLQTDYDPDSSYCGGSPHCCP